MGEQVADFDETSIAILCVVGWKSRFAEGKSSVFPEKFPIQKCDGHVQIYIDAIRRTSPDERNSKGLKN